MLGGAVWNSVRICYVLVTIVHEVGGDEDDEGGDYDRHNLVAVNTIKSVLDW